MISRQDALLVTVTSVALSGMTLPLHAQTAAAPASVSGSRLEEVVVTAEKRSAKAQATPIAITVVPAKQLQTRHVEDLTDLGALLPSVQMIPVSQTVQVSIRGVGSNFFDPRGQTSVSESIDGLAYARPAQVGNSFFDISRVEVLNGPQGTLYGTNAAAGAVNIVTNQPVNHYDGYIEASIGNYLMRGYAGMINIPVTDDLEIRIAGKGVYHNGYIENYYDDAANNAVRATVKWTPTNAFSAVFSYNYSDFNGHGVTPDSYPCDSKPYSNSVSQACAAPGGRQLSARWQDQDQSVDLCAHAELRSRLCPGDLDHRIDVASHRRGEHPERHLLQYRPVPDLV
jgi:iron complex outermembrane receptor protein